MNYSIIQALTFLPGLTRKLGKMWMKSVNPGNFNSLCLLHVNMINQDKINAVLVNSPNQYYSMRIFLSSSQRKST